MLLIVVPVLYALLLKFSEPHDEARYAIDVGMVVLGAIWAGLIAVSTAMYGKGDTLKDRLVGTYRQFLQRRPFLWLADAILLGVCGFLTYQLLDFRQIEFYAEEDAALILNDSPGELHELGILKGKAAEKFRLQLGNRHVVFSDPTTKSPRSSAVVSVQAIWHAWNPDRVTAPKPARRTYGKTNN